MNESEFMRKYAVGPDRPNPIGEGEPSPARLRLAGHVVARGGAIPQHGALFDAAADRIETLQSALLAAQAEIERLRPYERLYHDTLTAQFLADRRGWDRGRDQCVSACLGHKHVNVPREGGDELDRIARYSNATIQHCVTAIRALEYATPPAYDAAPRGQT